MQYIMIYEKPAKIDWKMNEHYYDYKGSGLFWRRIITS